MNKILFTQADILIPSRCENFRLTPSNVKPVARSITKHGIAKLAMSHLVGPSVGLVETNTHSIHKIMYIVPVAA